MPKIKKKALPKPAKTTKKSPAKKASAKQKPATKKPSKPAKKAPKAEKVAKAKNKEPKVRVKAEKKSKDRSSSKNGKISSKLAALLQIPAKTTLKPGQTILDTAEGAEKLRELVKLAKEQGYITYDDLNEALPDNVNDPDEMETIMGRLRSMEIEIIEASEVDRVKDGKKPDDAEEEEHVIKVLAHEQFRI